MVKENKKTTPSEVTEKKSGESPQMAVLSKALNLSGIVKPIALHVGENANISLSNRYMSVKGAFGIGAYGFMTWSGYCFVTKRPWVRPLLVTAAFGAVYVALDYKDSKLNAKTAAKDSSGDDKNDGTPVSNLSESVTSKPFELKTYSQLNDETTRNPDVWFVEGFVAIGLVNWLLAGAGVGKSIFMVQIAVAVSSGTKIEFLPQGSHIPHNTLVVFYRIEVFANEYSGKYGDGEMLENSGIKWRDRNDLSSSNYQGLIDDLKQMVEAISEDTLVCIDPATKLPDFDAGKFAEEAEILMNRAKEKGFCLTFLCSAHLDEIEVWKSLTTLDIRGGDRLIQTAGSVFAIQKERTGDEYRFIKILKESKGFVGDSQVLVCKIVSGNNFVHAEYVCHKNEAEALPLKPKAESDSSGKKSGVEPEVRKRNPDIVWTEEMLEKLKKMHQEGETDSKIADMMNQEYGGPTTKFYTITIGRKLEEVGLKPTKPAKTEGEKK